ncbi:MAG: PKD domain-containing protein [Euryarchaeota archaeon]|nr:PKD domain-containing protein [Euryarchaeota archaeon]MDE2044183.1 PKD domain-containing protein [Thermoplasmata archaeon]
MPTHTHAFAGCGTTIALGLLLVLLMPAPGVPASKVVAPEGATGMSTASGAMAIPSIVPMPVVPHTLAGHSSPATAALDWFNLTPRLVGSAEGPSPRLEPQFAWDEASGYGLFFGGWDGGAVDSDTWTFTPGSGWALSAASGPTGRVDGQTAWDSTDQEVVLFGGCTTSVGCPNAGTWTYTNVGGWVYDTGATAPGRTNGGIADDAVDHYDVMFGGCTAWNFANNPPVCTAVASDTQTFAGGSWTAPTPTTHPSARFAPYMAWDPDAQAVVLFGGIALGSGGSYVPLNDTWSFSGGQWTDITSTAGHAPSPRGMGGLAYQTGPKRLLLFGGAGASGNLADTWQFASGTWTPLYPTNTPSPRFGFAMASNSSSEPFVLWGGQGNSSLQNDTWVPTYPLRASASATPTTSDVGVTIAFTGKAGGGVPGYTYAWRFGDGNTSTAQNPTYAYGTPGAPYTVTLNVTDSTGAVVSAPALRLTINPDPSATLAANPPAPYVSESVMFTDTLTGGTSCCGQVTWSFGDGSPPTTTVGTTVTYSYGRPGTFVANSTTQDAAGLYANATTTVTVSPLAITLAASRSPIAGTFPLSVSFHATASGGAGPLTYDWSFGDGTVGTGATPSHTYTNAGSFQATVWANDSSLHSASFTLPIWAYAPLSATVSVTAGNLSYPGTPATISATATGGNGTLSYAWQLNGSAYSATTASFPFTSTGAGNYTFQVRVSDNAGQTSTRGTVLTVLRPGTTPPVLGVSLALSRSSAQGGTNVTATATPVDANGVVSYLWTLNGTQPFPHAGGSTSVVQFSLAHGATYQINVSATNGARVAWAQSPLVVWTGAAPTPLSVTISPSATSLQTGSSVVFTASVGGGVPPYVILWSENGTNLTNTGASLTQAFSHGGAYAFRAWVRDSSGVVAESSVVVVTVTMPTSPSSGSPSPTSLSDLFSLSSPWLFLLLALVVAALLLAALYVRRRRHPSAAVGASASATGPSWAASPATEPSPQAEPPEATVAEPGFSGTAGSEFAPATATSEVPGESESDGAEEVMLEEPPPSPVPDTPETPATPTDGPGPDSATDAAPLSSGGTEDGPGGASEAPAEPLGHGPSITTEPAKDGGEGDARSPAVAVPSAEPGPTSAPPGADAGSGTQASVPAPSKKRMKLRRKKDQDGES